MSNLASALAKLEGETRWPYSTPHGEWAVLLTDDEVAALLADRARLIETLEQTKGFLSNVASADRHSTRVDRMENARLCIDFVLAGGE